MKNVLINLINMYQKTPLSSHRQCRFIPTCSEYTKEAIIEWGSIKELWLGFKRILKCNPLNKGGIDLVPRRNK